MPEIKKIRTTDAKPHTAIIALGSNIRPAHHISRALEILTAEHRLLATSPLEKTSPRATLGQADFLNGACEIETHLDRPALKCYLREIENRLGRVRTSDKNGPRTIDLDITIFDDGPLDDDYHSYDFVQRAVDNLLHQRRQRETN